MNKYYIYKEGLHWVLSPNKNGSFLSISDVLLSKNKQKLVNYCNENDLDYELIR